MKKQRKKLQEDRPDIIVDPPCEPKIVYDVKTGVVEAVYSGSCSIKQVQDIAGKIAIEGLRFRPEKEPEETFFLKSDREKSKKDILEMTKEERQKDFDEKLLACETAKTEMKRLGIKPTLKRVLEETSKTET
ncbi:unnamed protein product, partial [marine sediment metagenome]